MPAWIIVSAYTWDGCIEELYEEAEKRGLQVKLKRVETNLIGEILLFPLYKGYSCFGEGVKPGKPQA